MPAGKTTSYAMPAIVASTAWFFSRTLSSVGLPDAIVVGEKSRLAPRPPDCAPAGAGVAARRA
jgi:hypothetical protein